MTNQKQNKNKKPNKKVADQLWGEEIITYFEEQCKKFELNPEDYMEVFCEKVEKFKRIRNKEDVIAYVKALQYKEQVAKKPKESQADRLVKYAMSKAYLFLDQHKSEYARVVLPRVTNATNAINSIFTYNITSNVNSKKDITRSNKNKINSENGVNAVNKHRLVIMPLHSKRFKNWLSQLMWTIEKKAPNSGAIQAAINVLSGKAQSDGKTYTLYNRIAPAENGIWIDITDENWRAIHVTAEGWEIVDEPPILFRRYSHQKPLAIPARVSEEEQATAVLRLLDFVNIAQNDEATHLMFITSVISYLVPEICHPVLLVYGPQGSAKTWLFFLIKRLLDPSSIEVLTLTKNKQELIQQLEHHWIVFFDNLSNISNEISNLICRAITGSGFSKRELYSNDNDFIYSFKRCIGLNGINPVARRADLLDRSIPMRLETITKGKRKTEEDLNAQFEKEKATILGGMLGILSNAIKIYPKVDVNYQRLTDFTKWGCAIAQALGFTPEDFESAYKFKVELQNEEALNASPLALALQGYFEENYYYWIHNENGQPSYFIEATPTELHRNVTEFADSMGIKTAKTFWPKAPNSFSRELNKIKVNLGSIGCLIEEFHTGTERKIKLDITEFVSNWKKTTKTDNTSESIIKQEIHANSDNSSDEFWKTFSD